jgi:hypothetical protein
MEYQRPRYDETPDKWLVERHEREIAPLLKRRWLFAESDNFLLYDFFQSAGSVDENVFAYSNRKGSERALVVYNNRYGTTQGTIDFSAAYADKGAGQLRQQRLREGLGLSGDASAILAFRDSLTGLEYLRRADEVAERGLTLDLHAYQCHVFLDWRELHATVEQPWDRLCDRLNGGGVPSLDDALVNLELRPVHDALDLLLDPGMVRLFADLAEHPRTLAIGGAAGKSKKMARERGEFFDAAWERCESFLRAAQKAYTSRTSGQNRPFETPLATSPVLLAPAFRELLRAALQLPAVEALFPAPWPAAARRMLPSPSPKFTATAMWGPVLGWCALELLAASIDFDQPERVALDVFDRLRLREPFAHAFSALGFEGEEGWRVAARIKVLLLTGAGAGEAQKPLAEVQAEGKVEAPATRTEAAIPEKPIVEEEGPIAPALWSDPDIRWLTGVHTADGHDYLVRESYEELLWWMQMPPLLRLAGESAPSRAAVKAMSKTVEDALAAAEAAGYHVDVLLSPAVHAEPGETLPGKAEATKSEPGVLEAGGPEPEQVAAEAQAGAGAGPTETIVHENPETESEA